MEAVSNVEAIFNKTFFLLDLGLVIAASIDEDIQNFFDTVNNIAKDMDNNHRRQLKELAWVKKNYARYLERRAIYLYITSPSAEN